MSFLDAKTLADLVLREGSLLEETLHECVVKLGGLLDKLLTKCLGLILQISRNLKILAGSVLVLEMIVLHLEDIDESVE